MSSKRTPVAAAVIYGPHQRILLAQRPEGKPYAGWWEFPGGKIEPGESPLQALTRELQEELGIEVQQATPWLYKEFVYPHATVALHFFRVWQWRGEPVGREGQAFAWQTPGNWTLSPMLPANQFILRALQLPEIYAISCAETLGVDVFLDRAEMAVQQGLRAIQVRDKSLPLLERIDLARELKKRVGTAEIGAQRHSTFLFWHGEAAIARELGFSGVHWNSQQLKQATERPSDLWVGASCHNTEELDRAAALGLDYALLSPVQATKSHPEASLLGWAGFQALIEGSPIPVYALGGLSGADLARALSLGAQGVAMLSAAWLAS